MTTALTPHPHAEILRAIADGVPLSEFEFHNVNWSTNAPWTTLHVAHAGWILNPREWTIRRKQHTSVVNGFTVPAPMDKEPLYKTEYFTPYFQNNGFYQDFTWADDCVDRNLFKRGLCFATREAAIANAKAMLKIDPEAA